MASFDDNELFNLLSRLALAGDGILLGVGVAASAYAVHAWIKFFFHSSALKKLESMPSIRISHLRFLTPSLSSFYEQPLVLVHGTVLTRASAVSYTSPPNMKTKEDFITVLGCAEKVVIHQRRQMCFYNEWRGPFGLGRFFGFHSLKDREVISIRQVPFVLKEGVAEVYINMKESSHPLPLFTVYQRLSPIKPNGCAFLKSLFRGVYPVAYLDEDKVLPAGKEITAVGLLDFAPNGELILMGSKKFPYFLTNFSRDELMMDLTSRTRFWFWTATVLSTCSVGIMCYAFFKNWQKLKEWRQRRQRSREQARQGRLLNQSENEYFVEDLPDVELCVICFTRRRKAAFLPCGHHACCMNCAERVQQDISCRCPVCRNSVHGSICIYNP